MSDKKKTCFVITPIGDENGEIRRHIDGIIDQVIEPAIGDKYKIIVSHREFEIGSINDRIIRSVYESDLVIANLTNTNPNVMFELAIRYSFGKPAIVIAEKGTKLPFDVIDQNTIFYVNDLVGADDLRKEICKYEKKIDLDRRDYGPVFKVINKIPLYNEVESRGETGEDVSKDKILGYIVDRLDTIEKNISFGKKDIVDESSVNYVTYSLLFINVNKAIIDAIRTKTNELRQIYPDLIILTSPDDGNFEVYVDGVERNVKNVLYDINVWARENKLAYNKNKLYS